MRRNTRWKRRTDAERRNRKRAWRRKFLLHIHRVVWGIPTNKSWHRSPSQATNPNGTIAPYSVLRFYNGSSLVISRQDHERLFSGSFDLLELP